MKLTIGNLELEESLFFFFFFLSELGSSVQICLVHVASNLYLGLQGARVWGVLNLTEHPCLKLSSAHRWWMIQSKTAWFLGKIWLQICEGKQITD